MKPLLLCILLIAWCAAGADEFVHCRGFLPPEAFDPPLVEDLDGQFDGR